MSTGPYADHDGVVRRAEEIHAMGFEWTAVNATAMPVVRIALRTASSMSAVSATSWRMRATM